MTSRQISITQVSFAQLLPVSDRVSARFYDWLFQLTPETRVMFKNDTAEQGRKLVDTLATVVAGHDHIETILPAVQDLVIGHSEYGVEEEHYGLVGLALIEALPVPPDRAGLRKLKHLLRKAAERSHETTWRRIGSLLDAFSPAECRNYLVNSDYAST